MAAADGQTAKPDTSHFLWFTGHWSKTKKNTFIIAAASGDPDGSSPGATSSAGDNNTVTINPDGSVQMSGGGVDDWNKRMDKAAKSEEDFIQQLEDPKDNLDPITKQFNQLLDSGAQKRLKQVKDLKIDAKQDILSPDTKPGQTGGAGPGQSGGTASGQSGGTASGQSTDDYCRKVKADYGEVIAWWKAHRKDKDGDLKYPPPPEFEYDCYACDTNIQISYQQQIDKYAEDFFHEEDELIRKATTIMHELSLDLWEGSKHYGDVAVSQAFHSSPCAYMDVEALAKAVYDISYHAFARGDKMRRDNKKNYKAISAIVQTWCRGTRQFMLLSGSKNVEDPGLAEMSGLAGFGVEYYYNKFRQNDWRQIGNYPYLLELMRTGALLSGNTDDTFFQKYLQQLQRIWNGFKLTVEMDTKIGKDGGYRIAHVKGEGHIIPAFQRDSNQCYKWVMADENSMTILGFYKPSALQTIDCNLLGNEMITPPQAPRMTYVGTKFYKANLQSLSMDFCNPGHDTIVLSGFNPNPMTGGVWQVPMAGQVNLGVNGLEQFFENVQEKKKLADDGEAQRAADQMKQQAEQLKAQMETLKSQMTGPLSKDSYEKIMEKFNQARSLSGLGAVAKMLWLDFVLPVKNNDPVLVDKKYDAKEINPQESPAIVYGYYTVHIENTGAGKTKSAPKK